MSGIDNSAVIHHTAIVEKEAQIGENSVIGPYCCIGKAVILEKGVRLESHVVIGGSTRVGAGTIIYPFASLGQAPQDLKYKGEQSRLEIGKNNVIREYVTANIGTEGGGMVTKIGDGCLIMAYCHIAHDCIIGNNVVLVNGVNLSGHVVIGDNAIVGGMSAVKQFIRIGRNAMIGGFTGVDRDVIPYGVARSNRITALQGLNVIGLKRNGFSLEEIRELQGAYREIFSRPTNTSSFTDNLSDVSSKYSSNPHVMDIIDFLSAPAKNPVCTETPTDS
jgi:UDP-N-acetylglucosamine acyltransferase